MLQKSTRKSILIVEDDECMHAILGRIIRSIDPDLAYQWVTTAEEAIAELRQNNHSLVLADVSLAGRASGLDLWESAHSAFPKLPFVMMSSMGVQTFLGLIGRKRASPAFLAKPFYPGECRQIIESMLNTTARLF